MLVPSSPARLRARVLGLLALLMFMAGTFTALDFSRMFMALTDQVAWHDWPDGLSQTSAWVRMLRSVLCLVLVGMIGPGSWLRRGDDRLLTAAFLCAVIGDAFLIFREDAPHWYFLAGVGGFVLCHVSLTVRHLTGIRDDVSRPGVVPRLAIAAVGIAAGCAALVAAFWSVLRPLVDVGYVAIMGVSLWAGLSAAIRADTDDFPVANRWLIAVGMLLFCACDLSLGIHARLVHAQDHTDLALCMGMVPDLTYSWALMALALSGFRWDVLTGRRGPPRAA